MLALPLLLVLAGDLRASGCSFARPGVSPPIDEIHRHLHSGQAYPVLPQPVTLENNAFVTNDLLRPITEMTGNNKSIMEVLNEYAGETKQDLCYWAFQALPPPRGGPSLFHPKRGYWDVSDGHNDQDIEWVQAYGEAAVARLQSRVKKDGPIMGAMCSLGHFITKRRCENGRSRKEKCIPAITNGTIAWPMAVSLWKIGHPELKAANLEWRASTSGHLPMIEWDKHTAGDLKAYPWTGPMPKPGETKPSAMPAGPSYPASKDVFWGSPKIAKVVKCSDIPSKYKYNMDNLFYCDSMSNSSAGVSAVDEAYAVWRSLQGAWPPTQPCADDMAALNASMAKYAPLLVGHNCSEVYSVLQKSMPNFDCDNTDIQPLFRNMCCSVCGQQPIPRRPTPSPPPPATAHQCTVCNHVYDADKDGAGTPFEDLPSSWLCPVCGAPKAAYNQRASGEWAVETVVAV